MNEVFSAIRNRTTFWGTPASKTNDYLKENIVSVFYPVWSKMKREFYRK